MGVFRFGSSSKVLIRDNRVLSLAPTKYAILKHYCDYTDEQFNDLLEAVDNLPPSPLLVKALGYSASHRAIIYELDEDWIALEGMISKASQLGEAVSIDAVSAIVAQLCHLIDSLHKSNILLGNFDTKSVFINPSTGLVKMSYDLARYMGNNPYKQTAYSLSDLGPSAPVLSPELVLGFQVSYSVDSWLLGVLVYRLLYQKYPHTHLLGKVPKAMMTFLLDDKTYPINFTSTFFVYTNMEAFLGSLLCRNAGERPPVGKLIMALPWVEDFAWVTIIAEISDAMDGHSEAPGIMGKAVLRLLRDTLKLL